MQAEIGWLDTAAGKWVPLASTSSASAVVAETDHFTKFAVRQVPKLARPTGRMMINGSASSLRMYEINLAGGDAVSRGYGTGPCLTKDGKVIYDDGNLVESSLDGTTKRVIVKNNGDGNYSTPWDSDFANPQVSPDDTRIAYVASDQLYVVDRAAGTLVAEFTVKGITEGYERPTWTPDGRIVVAGAFANPGLYVSDAALETLTKFSPMIDRPREPAVSPDGKQVAFVLASHVYVMNLDGTGLRQITTSSSDERYPFWSPDGKWVAMYGNFSVIAVPVPAVGAPPVDVRSPDVYDVLKRHPGGDHNRSYQSSWR
jgi:Tol biopolymer transport system component